MMTSTTRMLRPPKRLTSSERQRIRRYSTAWTTRSSASTSRLRTSAWFQGRLPRYALASLLQVARRAQLTIQLQILKLSRKVWNSPTIRAELANLAADAHLNSEVLIRSVKTRWNTGTEVLGHTLEMRAVLTDLCDMVQFKKAHGVRLRQFVLSDEEWVVLQQLHDLLDVCRLFFVLDNRTDDSQPFLFATKEISTSGQALVHQVIAYIDVLTRHVDSFKANDTLHPAVRAAAQRGRVILDKYYSLTDDSIVYHVTMSKHIPCCMA